MKTLTKILQIFLEHTSPVHNDRMTRREQRRIIRSKIFPETLTNEIVIEKIYTFSAKIK